MALLILLSAVVSTILGTVVVGFMTRSVRGHGDIDHEQAWFARWLVLERSMMPWPVRGSRGRRFLVEMVVAGVVLGLGILTALWLG